jgi:uncharacterized membrane protein YedE/YeeE
MDHFTPVSALVGGLLIGLATAVLWLGNGRIAGISGIVGNLATARRNDIAWRIAFAVGLVAAAPLYAVVTRSPAVQIDATTPIVIGGRLLVGFGTRLGGGCTSGHGVCGIARISPRSLVATGLFMTAGFATVFLTRHVMGG